MFTAPTGSSSSREIHVTEINELAAPLLECSQSLEFLCLVLPDGRRMWVHPEENLHGLASFLADRETAGLFERAARDVGAGRGTVLDEGTMHDAMRDAVGQEAFADLMDAACSDVKNAAGRVFDADQRPGARPPA